MRRALALVLPMLLTGCGLLQVRVGSEDQEGTPGPEVTAPADRKAEGKAPAPAAAAKKPAKTGKRARPKNGEDAAIHDALQYVEAQKHSYKISPADLIEITVYQEDELNRKVRVSPDGIITFPLVGKVRVAGLSVAEAEQAVQGKLKRYVINPQVSVFISEYGNKQVYVLGEVKKPGSYALPTERPLTVLEAITLAGGFTEYAAIDRTRVIRKERGRSRTFDIQVTAITKRGEKDKDIQLISNDVIYVPESFF